MRIEGLLDGTPFEFKLAGKEVKLEGLNLTQAEFTSLVSQLKTIPGLHEAKIESLVDGKERVVKLENKGGRMKVEDLERHNAGNHHDADDDHHVQSAKNSNKDAHDRPERLEKLEKAERPVKVEHIERPEIEHGGSGRH